MFAGTQGHGGVIEVVHRAGGDTDHFDIGVAQQFGHVGVRPGAVLVAEELHSLGDDIADGGDDKLAFLTFKLGGMHAFACASQPDDAQFDWA